MSVFICSACGKEWPERYCPECSRTIDAAVPQSEAAQQAPTELGAMVGNTPPVLKQPEGRARLNSEKKRKSLLVGASEEGLWTTILVAAATVGVFAALLRSSVSSGTWLYDFFFHRAFVQWVLLAGFSVGCFHLVLRRIPAWLRERRALASVLNGEEPSREGTFAARRWAQLKSQTSASAIQREKRSGGQFAEHDEAELDAAYRISGDIVQMLPLIGFFGTVYGLSRGLYASFLTEGTVSTTSFAKAIAIAFDNTLLGLALTILLFGFQGVLRKREDSTLLELNLWTTERMNQEKEAEDDSQPENTNEQVTLLAESLRTFYRALTSFAADSKSFGEEFKDSVRKQIEETGTTVLSSITAQQRAGLEELHESVSSHLKLEATKLFEIVAEKASVLAEVGEPLRTQLAEVQAHLGAITDETGNTAARFAASQKEGNDQLQRLAAMMDALLAEMRQREAQILRGLTCAEEVTASMSPIAVHAERLSNQVAAIREKADSLPEQNRLMQELASAIQSLLNAFEDRETRMMDHFGQSLRTHADELKVETARLVNQPRTYTLVEAPGKSDGDGKPETK